MDAIVGFIAALTLSMLSLVGFSHYAQMGVKNVQTAALASQNRIMNQAVSQYVEDNAAALSSTLPVGGTTPQTISLATLQAAGYLPASFAATNPFGQTWQAQVLQPTAGQLQTIVEATGGSAITDTAQLTGAAAQVGAEGGFVPYADQGGDASMQPTVAAGAYGAWKINLSGSGFTNPGSGHPVSLLAFTNLQTNANYLYRVQIPGQPQLNAMQTDLSMTGSNGVKNNLTGANVISAQSLAALNDGTQAVPSVTMANGKVVSWHQVGAGGVLGLVGDNGQAVYLESNNGTFSLVNSALGANLMTVDQSGNVVAAGSGAFGGNVTAGGNGAFGGSVTAAGVGTFGGSVTTAGYYQFSGSGAVKASTCSTTGAMAQNADGSGQILSCQQGLWLPAGVAIGSVGQSCSTQGGIGQDTSGNGLICQSGAWEPVQARMGAWAMEGSYYTQNGSVVSKPTCLNGATPSIIITPGAANTVNSSGSVNFYATDNGSSWTVNMVDGNGNALQGYALSQTYCGYY